MNRLPPHHTPWITALFAACLAFAPRIAAAQDETDTSTTGIRFPEEGGPLPRAPMPEGGVEKEWDQKEKPPEHKDPQGKVPGEDEPGLPHHGEKPEHGEPRVTEEQFEERLTTRWDGYLKVIGEIIENDPGSTFVGRNDGFRIGNARLGLTAMYGDNLHAYLSLEASVAATEELNQPNAELAVGPRDLYIAYDFSRHAGIRVGRFKAPYDLGELEGEGERVFIDTPLESRGVQPTQGFELLGMRQGRQIGVLIGRERLGLSETGFDIGYALALTNGRTDSFALNDNDRPAGFARFSFYFGKYVELNVAGFTDERTVGDLPDLFDEDVKGGEVSLVLQLGDLRLEGQGLYQRSTFPTSGAPAVNAMGVHGQWSYRLWGFEAAYRFAYYDPNDNFDVDAVWEHTLGISYYLNKVPLRFTLNATLTGEQESRELENNRIGLLTQYTF